MHKAAIIFDLDNTIYAVRSIGAALFRSLFDLIGKEIKDAPEMEKIKADLMRRPFQLVAEQYHFSDELVSNATDLLQHLTYTGPVRAFRDYDFTKSLRQEKFLVTTGFPKLQQSKIDALGIASDFKEIHIVDPAVSGKTKKDVFTDILHRYNFRPEQVVVVGDDLESEIKAARELNITAFLYDHYYETKNNASGVFVIHCFEELEQFL